MNPIQVIVPGLALALWVVVLIFIMFRQDGKLPGPSRNVDFLLPFGFAWTVLMWMFALVVFSSAA
jgi:hypothetical protein